MTIESKEDGFIRFCCQISAEACRDYFKRRDELPIDEAFLEENAFYASILYDVAFDIEPSLRQAEENPYGGKKAEEILQNAYFLYGKWKQKGLDGAITSYCMAITDLISKKAMSKSKGGYVLIPNMMAYSLVIRRALLDRSEGKLPIKNLDRVYVL